jgi:hypothetical protein
MISYELIHEREIYAISDRADGRVLCRVTWRDGRAICIEPYADCVTISAKAPSQSPDPFSSFRVLSR